jgi:aspartate kinase
MSNGIFGRSEEGSQSPPLSSPRGGEAYPWGPGSGMTPLANSDSLPEFHATVDLIRQEHFNAARASVQDTGILQELEAEIERDCEWLRSFLYASQVRTRITLLTAPLYSLIINRSLMKYPQDRRTLSSVSGSASHARL